MRSAFCIVCLFAVSCAPSVYKARIDTAASGSIVWPGAPEKPRIKYLWSLRDVSVEEGKEKSALAEFLGGSENIPDLRSSAVLLRPQGIYVDDRRYYIADPGASRVTVIDRNTMEAIQITEAKGEGFEYPRGVVADREGNIYVSDSDSKTVMAFSPDGRFRAFFEGEFERPEGLAIDLKRGVIYVVDTNAHTVYEYGVDGKMRRSIGRMGKGDGEFYFPTYACVDRDGNLYVTDFLNFRIQKFSPGGSFLKTIGALGDSYDTLDKPKGVAVDNGGHIYIVDGARHMVKIFSQEGRLLLFFGEFGDKYGEFYLPAGIFIDEKDVIYVADALNMRVQAFQFLGGD